MKFLFRETQILRDRDPIGRGSFGEVLYAKCDSLLCAAKCVHRIFHEEFEYNPANRNVLDGFEREYAYLSSMKHPNIVQYLGYYVDHNNESYLLMELMDESLTHYLEKLDGPVPFHKTIDFTHGIAMGLDYLHYNDIMHCDLSGNNVLLMAGYRAKISDFGQSVLVTAASDYRVRGNLAPGAVVYMPPEALREPPEFSSKLDNFSLGVIMIQILTRLYPNPSDPTTTLEGMHPGSAGTVLPVKELVRRGAHLAMIDHRHPLYQLAIYCIKDDENERPDIVEICKSLCEIEDNEPEYKKSKKLNPTDPVGHIPKTNTQIDEMRKQIRELQVANQTLESDAVKMQFIIEKKTAILEQTGITAVPPVATSTPTTPPQPTNPQSTPRPSFVPNTTPIPVQDLLIANKKLKWYPCAKSPVPLYGGSAVAIGNRTYVSGQALNVIYEYNPESNSWAALPKAPTASFSLVSITGILTVVGGYDEQGYSGGLYSLVNAGGSLVWKQNYPSMKHARVSPGAACNDQFLVVAGGDQQVPGSRLLSNSCEILNIQTKVWTIGDTLPKSLKRLSLTLCGDRVCILGGIGNRDQPISEIFFTSLQQLAASAAQRGLSGDLNRAMKFNNKCWNTMPAPVVYGTCTTLCGCVVLVGGWGTKPSNAVYVFDPTRLVGKNTPWHYIGPLPLARMDAVCTVLPGDCLVVIGGRNDNKENPIMNAVEMAYPS